MFEFRNIDNFLPYRFERIGTLKGKRWYIDKDTSSFALFKPQRNEYGDKKVFCANHYGEFVGYLLAKGVLIPTCKAELAHLNRYYPDIHKERNKGTAKPKDGCIIYSLLKPGEILEAGIATIEKEMSRHREEFNGLIQNEKYFTINDNIEVVLKSIELRIRDFYKEKDLSREDINQMVDYNRNKAIQMIVYDCLNGNNDRHDENWSMVISEDEIKLYPLYDNERVLGLYENQRVIENAINENRIEDISEKMLFSRMRIPNENKPFSTYKDVLKYLMHKYPDETKTALNNQLSQNTPEKIRTYLEECDGLPECYITFGEKMYKERYSYARELLKRDKELDESIK